MVLVCQYGVRTEDLGMVFQLIGCCYRLVRLLGLGEERLNLPTTSPDDNTRIESERRLIWSCYILDNLIGAGVKDNHCWMACPSIPLPVSETDFVSRMLPSHNELPTIKAFSDDDTITQRLNLRSHIIHLVSLRTQVLR